MSDLQVHVEFHSAGYVSPRGAYGSHDQGAAKEELGLPMIPATTLTAVLRHAAEQAAFALDEGQRTGDWHDRLDRLFGSRPTGSQAHGPPGRAGSCTLDPRPAWLSITPARLSEPFQTWVDRAPPRPSAALLSGDELADGCFMARAAVRTSEPGEAIDDTLRMAPWACGGLELTAEASLHADAGVEEEFLLLVAAANVRSLGGKRQRGLGRCTVRITGLDWDLRTLASQLGIRQQDASDQAGRQPTASPPIATAADVAASGDPDHGCPALTDARDHR